MDEVQKHLEHYGRDIEYYNAHFEDLLRQYPECWVAIYGEQVVGADPDIRRLIADLKQKGVPPNRVFAEFLSKEPVEYLFIEYILGEDLLV